jgi:hypothetical protein
MTVVASHLFNMRLSLVIMSEHDYVVTGHFHAIIASPFVFQSPRGAQLQCNL